MTVTSGSRLAGILNVRWSCTGVDGGLCVLTAAARLVLLDNTMSHGMRLRIGAVAHE